MLSGCRAGDGPLLSVPELLTPIPLSMVCTPGENDAGRYPVRHWNLVAACIFCSQPGRREMPYFRPSGQRTTFEQLKQVKTPRGWILTPLPEEVKSTSILAEVVAFMRREEIYRPPVPPYRTEENVTRSSSIRSAMCRWKSTAKHVR